MMSPEKRATLIAAIAALIIGPLALHFLFDVKFVNRTVTTKKGLMFETSQESAKLRQSLDAKGIRYEVKTDENGVKIWWSVEDDEKVKSIDY